MAEVVEGKRKVLVDGLDVKHKYHVKKTSQDSSMGNPAVHASGGLLSLERSQPFSHWWRIGVQL